MNTRNLITAAQILVSVFIIISILLQNRGEGLGSFLGGGGEVFRSRRGLENSLYYLTITLAVILIILSIVNTTLT